MGALVNDRKFYDQLQEATTQAKASATEAKLQLRQAKRRRKEAKEALISGISILFRPQQIEK